METIQEEIREVDDDMKLHLVIVGPEKSGKTKLARALSKEHKRNVISMDELKDWHINNNTEVGKRV
jgi:shikimate kinase